MEVKSASKKPTNRARQHEREKRAMLCVIAENEKKNLFPSESKSHRFVAREMMTGGESETREKRQFEQATAARLNQNETKN